jgi:hypothetical protein
LKKLGSLYLNYAFVVGGGLLALLLIGTQAARSTGEAVVAIVLGLSAPIPMLLLGLSLRRGWRVAPLLCFAAPIVMGFAVSRVWGHSEPTRTAGLMASFVFNGQYSQLYYLPGAVVLGALVLATLVRGRRRATTVST